MCWHYRAVRLFIYLPMLVSHYVLMLSVRHCMCSSIQGVVFAVSMVRIDRFSPNLSQVYLGTKRNWWGFWGQKVKVKVTVWQNMLKIPYSGFVFMISPVCIDGFTPNVCHFVCSKLYLGTKMNRLAFGSKGQGPSPARWRAQKGGIRSSMLCTEF